MGEAELTREMLQFKPVDVLLVLGQGVKPQLRGPEGERHVVIGSEYDSQGLRSKAIAVKELATHRLLSGPVIISGGATAGEVNIKSALGGRQADAEKALVAIREDKGADYQPSSAELTQKLIDMAPNAGVIALNQALGRPSNQQEADKVKQATEAGTTAELIKVAVVKPGVPDRKTISVDILEEGQARNTTQNVIYMLNMLDRKAGKMWQGSVGVLSSNNGHLQRAEGILQAYGIDPSQITVLSAGAVLEHYGYNHKYLEGLKEIDLKDVTLKSQGRWVEGVRRLPEYVLPELHLLENDDRLRSVLSSLAKWYKGVDIDIFKSYPELQVYEAMDSNQLRQALKAIPRQLPLESWANEVNVDQYRQQAAEYDSTTKQWIESNKS